MDYKKLGKKIVELEQAQDFIDPKTIDVDGVKVTYDADYQDEDMIIGVTKDILANFGDCKTIEYRIDNNDVDFVRIDGKDYDAIYDGSLGFRFYPRGAAYSKYFDFDDDDIEECVQTECNKKGSPADILLAMDDLDDELDEANQAGRFQDITHNYAIRAVKSKLTKNNITVWGSESPLLATINGERYRIFVRSITPDAYTSKGKYGTQSAHISNDIDIESPYDILALVIFKENNNLDSISQFYVPAYRLGMEDNRFKARSYQIDIHVDADTCKEAFAEFRFKRLADNLKAAKKFFGQDINEDYADAASYSTADMTDDIVGDYTTADQDEPELAGLVYLMTNKAFNEEVAEGQFQKLTKVGYTALDVEERASSLNGTNSPYKNIIYATFPVSLANYDKVLHRAIPQLSSSRCNPRREFFRINPEDAFKLINDYAAGHPADIAQGTEYHTSAKEPTESASETLKRAVRSSSGIVFNMRASVAPRKAEMESIIELIGDLPGGKFASALADRYTALTPISGIRYQFKLQTKARKFMVELRCVPSGKNTEYIKFMKSINPADFDHIHNNKSYTEFGYELDLDSPTFKTDVVKAFNKLKALF